MSQLASTAHMRVGPTCLETGYESAAYRRTLRTVDRLAANRTVPILIEGESGTGKTTIARRIHSISPRASAAFQHVLLSALDDNLCTGELFGHVAGAFTDARLSRKGQFACAQGGTIFLDEIGKASMAVQQRLLHVIETGEFRPLGTDIFVRADVRVIAASNIPLQTLVESGRFLPDLYARLHVFRVEMPPLRERRADIARLVDFYVESHSGEGDSPSMCPLLMAALVAAPWPNNLRQLNATVQRILIESDGAALVSLAHCTGDLRYLREITPTPDLTADEIRSLINATGSVSAAARSVGVDRTTLYRRLRREDGGESDRRFA